MKSHSTHDYGALIEPATVKIERRLPGPIERVWAYLTQSDLRRQWLAAGDMPMKVGASFELVWRNNELTNPPGTNPFDGSGEHRMTSRLTGVDPPRKLSFEWGDTGGVTFELEEQGDEVLLKVIHRRLPDRKMLLLVSTGWHAHLDVLVARMRGEEPDPFWDRFTALRSEYDARLPA